MDTEQTDIQQLYRTEPDGNGGTTSRRLFPTTFTRSVYDGKTGLTLDTILRYFNSVYIDYKGSAEATRNAVPPTMRREGLVITYTDLYGVTVNERCTSDADKDSDSYGHDANWVRLFYVGNEYTPAVDRGDWTENGQYYAGTLNAEKGRYERSDVWYWGCKYRCMQTGVKGPPTWNNAGWKMIEGNPRLEVEFVEPDTVHDPDRFDTVLTLLARLHNQDITDELDSKQIAWSRSSQDALGRERTESDAIWTERRGLSGKAIHLTQNDLNAENEFPSRITFTATVTLTDSDGDELTREQVTYEY
jgi:hypothetical protein